MRFAIVAARFNERITQRLVAGALGALRAARLGPDAIEVHWFDAGHGALVVDQAIEHHERMLRFAQRVAGVI